MNYQLQIGVFDKPKHSYVETKGDDPELVEIRNRDRVFQVTETIECTQESAYNFVHFLLNIPKWKKSKNDLIKVALGTKENTKTFQEGQWHGWRLIEIE